MAVEERVAFVGLGVMGFPMAGHLAETGLAVTVFNRTTARAAAWVERYGGERAASPAEAAAGAAVVLTCVGNDADVRHVVQGPTGVFAGMKEGSVLVDHTTASATLARELHQEASEKGLGFLDAPISGGQSGAEQGILTVMMGGEEQDFRRVQSIVDVYARRVALMGPAGCGQLTKMVNQIAIAGLLQGLSEALHFAKAADLDPAAVVEVISKGAAQSWQMENRSQMMIDGEFDSGFAVEWMQKDLGMTLAEGRRNGSHLPITALIDQFYGEVAAMGGSRWDTSSLITRLESLRRRS